MRYIATLRAVFDADDEISAILIADRIAVNGSKDLDTEDDDSLDVTNVINADVNKLTPEESIEVLKRGRNVLIRTRIKQCLEMARELDKMCYILAHRNEDTFDITGYDYGHFLDVAENVLDGKMPTD
jgi:hypothetical protein